MKIVKIFCTVSLIILCLSLVLSSCNRSGPVKKLVPTDTASPSENWTPPAPVANDSIVLFESGPSYIGNSASANKNNYPPVNIAQATLEKGTTSLHVSYRADIESPRGEIRYNIISVYLTSKDESETSPQNNITTLSIYTLSVPAGLPVKEVTQWSGDLASGSLLSINVPADFTIGRYKFDIGILINGEDFGTLPCTLTVSK